MPYRNFFTPWIAALDLNEFSAYGCVLNAEPFFDSARIKIALQPGDECLAGSTRERCRQAGFELAQKAIAAAWDRYHLEEIHFAIDDRGSYPIEMTLELVITEKSEL